MPTEPRRARRDPFERARALGSRLDPVATYTYPLEISRWAGEVSQLVEAIELIGTDRDEQIRINITLKGLNIRDATVGDLEALSPKDRARVTEVTVAADETGPAGGVYLRLGGGPLGSGLILLVSGEDRITAKGLFGRLTEILAPKSPGWLTSWRVGVTAMASVFVTWMLVLDEVRTGLPSVLEAFVWIVIVLGSTIAVGMGAAWMFTPIELLAIGERPRSRRFRTQIFLFALAVASSVVATYVA